MSQRTTALKPVRVSWISYADLKAAEGDPGAGLGPIAQAVGLVQYNFI